MNPQSGRTPEAFAQAYLEEVRRVSSAVPLDGVAGLIGLVLGARDDGRRVFICGNGGSAAAASHLVVDLQKTATSGGGAPVRAVSLTDAIPVVTAIANDSDYSEVFAAQLRVHASAGDVLIVISASGNSPNVLRALEEAKALRLQTAALVGMGGGTAAGLADVAVVVPSDEFGPVEDMHVVLGHLVTAYLREHPGES